MARLEDGAFRPRWFIPADQTRRQRRIITAGVVELDLADRSLGPWSLVSPDDAVGQRELVEGDDLGDPRSEDPVVGEASRITAHHPRVERELIESLDGFRCLVRPQDLSNRERRLEN